MKLLIYIVSIFTIMLGTSKCNQSEKLVNTPPFTTGEVMCENWETGKYESGTNLFIPIEKGKEIELDSAYFRGQIVKLERIRKDNYLVYIGRFKNTPLYKKDMVLHSDPKKEAGNTVPILKKELPFELKENEAIVSFIEDGKEKYYKIKNVKVSPTVKN